MLDNFDLFWDQLSYLFFYYFKVKFTVTGRHPEVFCVKPEVKNFAKYSGKHLQSSSIFIGNGKPRPVTLQSIGLHHRFFSSNFFQDFSEKLFCRALVNNIYGIGFFSTSCVVSSCKYIVNHRLALMEMMCVIMNETRSSH